jgi:hypothetical protein
MISIRIPNKLQLINDRHYSKFDLISYTLGGSNFSKVDIRGSFDFTKL